MLFLLHMEKWVSFGHEVFLSKKWWYFSLSYSKITKIELSWTSKVPWADWMFKYQLTWPMIQIHKLVVLRSQYLLPPFALPMREDYGRTVPRGVHSQIFHHHDNRPDRRPHCHGSDRGVVINNVVITKVQIVSVVLERRWPRHLPHSVMDCVSIGWSPRWASTAIPSLSPKFTLRWRCRLFFFKVLSLRTNHNQKKSGFVDGKWMDMSNGERYST